MLAEFHFLRPGWLPALLPLALLLWWVYRPSRFNSAWQRVCDPHLLRQLLLMRGKGSRLPLLLLGMAWLLAVLALAGPTWAKRPQPVVKALDARVIVLDLSRSMGASDLQPSRLARARFKVADMLERSAEGQNGLVVFAGAAFVVSPLTQDAHTISALLPALEPEIMPAPGSRPELGLIRAAELLEQAGFARGDIFLVTDGGGDKALETARDLHKRGFSVSVLAVGTREGSPIPLRDGGFLTDAAGNIVVPRLDETALRDLAKGGGGRYASISADHSDLDYLFDQRAVGLGIQTEQVDRQTELWREEGPWLLLPLLPLAAFAFRRGWLIGVMVGVLMLPQPSWAFSWADLWSRRDQQAAQALKDNDPARAAELAEDAMLQGAAAYRAGDYEQALEAFGRVAGADARYNLGNALARLGRYQEAIQAYDEALATAPGLEDAEANRAAVEALLHQQQAQQGGKAQNPEGGESSEQSGQQQAGSEADSGQDHSGEASGGEHDAATLAEGQGEDTGDNARQPGTSSVNETEEPEPEPDSAEQVRGQELQRDRAGQANEDSIMTEQPSQAASALAESEAEQVLEQWLRRIPDDPGGLLRRKFLYQYRRQADKAGEGNGW